MPVFVKEGSIIPIGPGLQYTSQKPADTITLFVYTGNNASFNLYEDEDTNYNYEKGMFATIQIDYNEDDRSLTINDRKGEFPGMLQKRIFNIIWITKSREKNLDFDQQPDERVLYGGEKQVLRMK
jgi:alpha-D-xyloside xylohydrolase